MKRQHWAIALIGAGLFVAVVAPSSPARSASGLPYFDSQSTKGSGTSSLTDLTGTGEGRTQMHARSEKPAKHRPCRR